MQLTRPYPHHPVFPPFSQISILDPHPLNSSWIPTLFFRNDTRPAIPMPPLSLIIHFCHWFAGRCDDAPRVEHHARDRVVIGVGVVNGAGT